MKNIYVLYTTNNTPTTTSPSTTQKMNAQELADHLTQKLTELTEQTERLKAQLPSDTATLLLNNQYNNTVLLYEHDTYMMKMLKQAIENIKNGQLCHCECLTFYNSYLCTECSKVICGDCSYNRTCRCSCRMLYKI
jgi:hypothetical protein